MHPSFNGNSGRQAAEHQFVSPNIWSGIYHSLVTKAEYFALSLKPGHMPDIHSEYQHMATRLQYQSSLPYQNVLNLLGITLFSF